MTVFQAVAAGLPVITTKIRAAADYLKEPDNCLWVEPKEPGIIADKIRSLMDDSVMRQHMAANNRALGAQFTRSIISAEFLGIYKVVVNRGEARLHCHAHILP